MLLCLMIEGSYNGRTAYYLRIIVPKILAVARFVAGRGKDEDIDGGLRGGGKCVG